MEATGQIMRDAAKALKKKIPGYGFALVVFEFNNPGVSNYISNANREDMIKALFETAYRLKADEDYKTREK